MKVGIGFSVTIAACFAASAQSLIEPERLDRARKAFETASKASPLRCQVNPVQPALTYSLRFQTGYSIDIPLRQFRGSGHSLDFLLRVTPDRGAPSYLSRLEMLPEVPETKSEGEFTGWFVVGEGAYTIEALVQDDAGRVCSSKWRIQARRTGSERELKPAMQPAAVGGLSPAAPAEPSQSPAGQRIERLTILLDAAPSNPRATKLEPETAAMLRDSVGSMLDQLPASRVRLVAFNLDQQVVLLRKDTFGAGDLEQLTTAFDRLQLAVVDLKTLQNRDKIDVVSDLVVKELRDPQAASAVVFLGPRTHWAPDPTLDRELARSRSRWFQLQYQRFSDSPFRASPRGTAPRAGLRGRPANNAEMDGGMMDASQRYPGRVDGVPLTAPTTADGIEQLLRRLKGKTFPIRNPHDFADAVRHMVADIPRSDATAEQVVAQPEVGPRPVQQPFLLDAHSSETNFETIVSPASDLHEGEDPIEVLMHLRDQVLAHAARVPNHTCIETMERDAYQSPSQSPPSSCDALLAKRKQGNLPLQWNTTDRLRFDVGLADGNEIYSWAGAPKFEDGDLDDLVPEGAIGTGAFAAMLLNVFQKPDPRFQFDGVASLDGRRLLQYSFDVPERASLYRVRIKDGTMAHKEWIVTGYTGTLLVDPGTAELVRFTVRTEELPRSTHLCEVDTTLEYGMVALGSFDYLLPKLTSQRFIGKDGSEAENRLTFTSCREYRGEATLAFGAAPVESASPPGAATPMALPAGLRLTVDLAAAVSLEQAAAGDRIEGRLAKSVLDSQGTTLAPEGARVQGRLMRVEVNHQFGEEHIVALGWENVEINGVKLPLQLKPNWRTPDPAIAASNGLLQRGTPIELPRPGEERSRAYRFPARHTILESGFRTEWVTVSR